jgi:hypothetical protein
MPIFHGSKPEIIERLDMKSLTPWWWERHEPGMCRDNTHVFVCDHEETCVCGKTQRVKDTP